MKRLALLDYARLAAALAVMAYHYLLNGLVSGKVSSGIEPVPELAALAKYGYLGVEFFFMISGYVIFFSAKGKTAGQFATSRVVRLYPAFWTCLLITSAFAMVWGTGKLAVTLPQVLVNATMVPVVFGVRPVDGVYWTLLFEAAFYAGVFLILFAGWGRHLGRIFLVWPLAMLAAVVFKLGGDYYIGYFAFFSAGALFAMMRDKVEPVPLASLAVALYLCLNGALSRADLVSTINSLAYSHAVIGGTIVVFFAFFFLQNALKDLRLPGSRLAGALTYPVYLLHAHIGYMLLSRFGTDTNKAIVYPLVVLFVITMAYAVHQLVEQRGANFWHALFGRWVGRPVDSLRLILQRGPSAQ